MGTKGGRVSKNSKSLPDMIYGWPLSKSTYLGRAASDDLERGLGVEADVGAAVDLALVPLGGVARRVGRDAARRQPVKLL